MEEVSEKDRHYSNYTKMEVIRRNETIKISSVSFRGQLDSALPKSALLSSFSFTSSKLLPFISEEFYLSPALENPGFVQVYHVLYRKNKLKVYYEPFSPENILSRLSDPKVRWQADSLLTLFLFLVDLLCHLHANGVPHRALSPSNILINKENKVKLIFFSNPELLKFLTPNNHEMYDSPEELLSKYSENPAPMDFFAADIWALGKTMYEICTLAPQQDFSQFIMDGCEEKFSAHIFKTLPTNSVKLKPLLLKLLKFNPSERPTASAVRDLLEKQCNGHSRYSLQTITSPYTPFHADSITPILQPCAESDLTKTYSEVLTDYLLASLPLLRRSL